jgi:hypothetical protein
LLQHFDYFLRNARFLIVGVRSSLHHRLGQADDSQVQVSPLRAQSFAVDPSIPLLLELLFKELFDYCRLQLVHLSVCLFDDFVQFTALKHFLFEMGPDLALVLVPMLQVSLIVQQLPLLLRLFADLARAYIAADLLDDRLILDLYLGRLIVFNLYF